MSELTDEEVRHIINRVAAPTFKFFMKRVNNEIIKQHKDMQLNLFINIFIVTMTNIDANALRWIENFFKMQSGQPLDFEALRTSFFHRLNEQLGIILQ